MRVLEIGVRSLGVRSAKPVVRSQNVSGSFLRP